MADGGHHCLADEGAYNWCHEGADVGGEAEDEVVDGDVDEDGDGGSCGRSLLGALLGTCFRFRLCLDLYGN